MRHLLLSAAVVGLVATVQVAWAESLTDEEILERFLIQRDAYTAVKTGKGKTRGLTIVTIEDLDPSGALKDKSAEVADVGGTDAGTGIGTGTGETGPVVASDGPVLDTPSTDDTGGVVVAGTEADPAKAGDGPDVILAANAESPIDPGQVGLLPEDLQVNVRISFDYDSALIKPDQMPVIAQMCRVIEASDIKLFRIMGHTDSAGSDAYNERLSLLRAEEVKRKLEDCGIAPDRLQAMGLGERFLFDKTDPKGSENRRVEFQAMS